MHIKDLQANKTQKPTACDVQALSNTLKHNKRLEYNRVIGKDCIMRTLTLKWENRLALK